MSKSYYIILGLNSDATQEEIKSAYREQVKQVHPDYYGGDSQPFLDLQEAYSVLGEPRRRQAYDKKLKKQVFTLIEPNEQPFLAKGYRSPIQPIEPIEKPNPIEEVFPNHSFEAAQSLFKFYK